MKYTKIFSLILLAFVTAAPLNAYSNKMNVLSMEDADVKALMEYLKMEQIQTQYYATLLNFDPERATGIGVHDRDFKLTERTSKEEDNYKKALIKNLDELKLIDNKSFTKLQMADYKSLKADIETDIRRINKADTLKKSPQYYLYAMDSIFRVLDHDFAPLRQRAQNAAERLADFPRILQQAQKNLNNPPKFWVEMAINDAMEMQDTVGDLLPRFRPIRSSDPILARTVDSNVPKVKTAISEYAKFLQTKVLPNAKGDYRIGESDYMWYLKNWHHIDFRASRAIEYATDDFKEVQNAFLEELRGYLKSSTIDIEHYSLTLDVIGENPIKESDLEKFVRQETEKSSRFFDRYKLLPMFTERPSIMPMPSYMKSRMESMSYVAPSPAEAKRYPVIYLLKTPKSMTANQKITYAKKYLNRTSLEFDLVYNLMPGEAFQNFMAQNASRINRSSNVPAVSGGWAKYAVTLAFKERYYSDNDWTRLFYLRTQLLSKSEAYIDIMLHTKRMTHEKAIEFLMRETGISNDEALLRVYRISMNPSLAYAEQYGANTIDKIAQDQKIKKGTKFDIREFYRDLLMIGTVPISDIEPIINSL